MVFEIFGQTEFDLLPPVLARRVARAVRGHRAAAELRRRAQPDAGLDGPRRGRRDLAGQPGVAGEAVYRSPAVIAGYYRDEAATRHAFRFGWFHSGDSCAYDDAGLRVMLDRYKDIVKTGGENVSSLRVEAVWPSTRTWPRRRSSGCRTRAGARP